MDQNTEFLNYIYQNSQMGADTLKQLTEVTNDQAFSSQLRTQLNSYQSINNTAAQKLNETGNSEKGLPKAAQISAYMSIGMKTLTNKSPEHISEMLIQGSTMGIIDVTKNIKKYSGANPDTVQLADQLLKTEQDNIEQLKNFL